MKNKIYRLRPFNQFTINELDESYLCFSKPTDFKDEEDANIAMFIEINDIVKKALSQVLSEDQIQELS